MHEKYESNEVAAFVVSCASFNLCGIHLSIFFTFAMWVERRIMVDRLGFI